MTGSYAVPTGAIRSSKAGLESAGTGVEAEAGAGRDAAGGGGGATGVGAGGGDGSRGGVTARGGGATAGAGVGRVKEEAGVVTDVGCPVNILTRRALSQLTFPWAPPNPWLGLKLVVGFEATGLEGAGAELLYLDPLDSWILL